MKFLFNPISIFLISATLLVVAFYVIAALYYPSVFVIATYEDLYGEWTQTYGFVITCLFSSLIALNKRHPQRWFFLLLAMASFYAFMEEISWGQRLLGFETPEFFHENSYQDETNIHNLLTGPVDVWTKTALTYTIAAGLFAYGVIFPLVSDLQVKPILWLMQHRIAAVPPLSLMLAFTIAALLELEPFSFNEAEVAELLIAWALAFTALHHWLTYRTDKETVIPYIIVVITATVAVWGTTTVLLNIAEQGKEIDHRLANGYEKFAERYESYDYTFGVENMLEHYDQLRPNNTVILRRIAENLELLEQSEKARIFLQRAVDEGLRRINKEKDNVQANISLAKSYRKLGDYRTMAIHANKAYDLALANYKADSTNAYWAYWLAKACEQTNRQHEALHYYRKAHYLEPSSSRYEEAYEQKKLIMLDYEN